MRRRTILAGFPAGASLFLGGCAGWGGYSSREITLESVEIKDVADRLARNVTATESDLIPSPYVRDLFSRLRNGERIEVEAIDLEFIDRGHTEFPLYHEADDGIYRVDRTVLNAGPVTGPEYHVSRVGILPDDVDPNDDDEVLRFAELPEVERWRLHEAFSFSDDPDDALKFFGDSTVIGYHDPDNEADSVLLDGLDQRYLDVDGDYVELEEKEERSARVEHIRLAAEHVADDLEAFAEYALGLDAVDANELSPDLQELFDELRTGDGSLYADSDDDSEKYEELGRLGEKLADAQRDQRLLSGGLYIRYEGEYYRISLHSDHAP